MTAHRCGPKNVGSSEEVSASEASETLGSGVGALYERTSFQLEECAVIDRTYTFSGDPPLQNSLGRPAPTPHRPSILGADAIQVGSGSFVVRVDGERAFEILGRFLQSVELDLEQTEVVECNGVVRVDFER